MSGHSKWATIKHKKAKEDAKRGKIFTKIIREITVAARQGGGDPAANSKLRLLIDKAKAANMPQDNITRAIKKGTGELAGTTYESAMYEGYGPGGIAVMVEVLTNNKNRTVSALRHLFSKMGGNLAEHGSVAWMFEQKGVIATKANSLTEDDILEKLIEYPIEDITVHEGTCAIVCAVKDIEEVKKGAGETGLTVESADIQWIAKTPLEIKDKSEENKALKFLEAVEDLDDVQNVHANVG
jgi:YebC/PmpR family DNA-binding regulatory protein